MQYWAAELAAQLQSTLGHSRDGRHRGKESQATSIPSESSSPGGMDLVFNAIAWIHSIGGKASPTKEAFVVATLKGLQRKHAKPVIKKKPFTTDMLRDISEDAAKTKSLSVLCLGTACLLAYSAFLRFDEFIRIRPADITFSEGWISIKIDKSEMD